MILRTTDGNSVAISFQVSTTPLSVVVGKGDGSGGVMGGVFDQSLGAGTIRVIPSVADLAVIGPITFFALDGGGAILGQWHGVVLAAYPSTGDPLDSVVPGGYAVGSAGYELGHNLDAPVSTRLATTSYTAPNNSGIVGNGNALSILQAGLSGGTYTIQLTTAQFDALIAAVWQTANQIDGQYTYQEAVRVILAALAGKLSIVGNVVRIRDTADTKDREAVTTDAIGQRTAVTLNVS